MWPSESVLVYRDACSRLVCCKGGSESEAEWDGSHRLLTFAVSSKFPSGSRGSHEVRPGCLLLTPPAQQIKYSLFSYTFFSCQLHLFCPHASPPGKSQVWDLHFSAWPASIVEEEHVHFRGGDLLLLSLKAALWESAPTKINDCRRPVLQAGFVLSHASLFFMAMQCVCVKAIK